MKVGLVCIAKNEENYIQEWVDYHIKLGFDNIFVYQNNWRCDYSNSQLVKIEFDGEAQQMNAYNNWLNIYKNEFDWVAFFDVDEFLVLKKHRSIKDFLSEYLDCNGVGINWYLFGNNGHEKVVNNEFSQIKRFTKRQGIMNQHIKTILNCRVNCEMSVHNPHGIPIVSPNRNQIKGPFNKNPNDEIAQLNHYFCKTPEEFMKKCERGRSDILGHKRTFEKDYHSENHNEIEDLFALNFMYEN